MALPDVRFIKGKGGLGRPAAGQDYISGLIFYTGTLPSGFSNTNRIKQFFQPADAIAAGILNDYSDATAATATYLITTLGATGDKIAFTVADVDASGNPQTTQLCNYTKVAGDTTIALLGASIAAAINAGTLTHGYTASFLTATLTITAPKKFGVLLNSGSPLTVTITGTIAGTLTAFSGGIASAFAGYYYHISEFFRINPKGYLYVGFFAVPGSYTFGEVATIQNFSNGVIRQVGVMKDPTSAWSSSDLTALHTACAALDDPHKPLSAIYAADLSGTVDISTLPDLNTLSANKASDCISQDAGGQGNFLWVTTKKSVTNLGVMLGTVSLSKVSESIGWVGKFNISDGVECEVLAFANGQLFSSSAISDTLLGVLNDRRHVFLRKFVGQDGSFWNGGHAAISVSSDYAYIEDNRTIDKAIRGIYTNILPYLNSPIQLNSDGTLSDNTVATFENAVRPNLDQMVRDGELSDYKPTVNPNQLVLVTGKVVVSVQLLQSGVARNIEVPIGFVPKIS